MSFTFQAFVLLTVAGWAFSDNLHARFHHDHKNIFYTPFREPCIKRGICIPLNDCPDLREIAEEGDNEDIASIIRDFGCGFHRVLHVCCGDKHDKRPEDFPEPMHYVPYPTQIDAFPTPSHGSGPHRMEENRPPKKGTDDDAKSTDDTDSVKPVYENSEGYKDTEGQQPVQFNIDEEDNRKNFTGPLSGNHQFHVPRMDSFTQTETSNPDNDTDSRTPMPEWHGTPAGFTGSASQGGFGQDFQNRRPNQDGFSADGWNQGSFSNGQTSYQGFDESLRPSNQGFPGGRPNSNSNYERPSNFGTDSSYVQGISGGSRPVNQGFGSGRPNQSGLGNQGPQQFGSSTSGRPIQGGFERPVGQGFGTSRPGLQSFGNERPGNTGFNRPDNYDIDYSPSNTNINRPSSGRPGSKRPTNQDNYSGQDSYGSNSFTNGGTNNHRPGNQRPNNEGSKKKPTGTGPNRKKPNRRLLPDGNCGTEISDKIIGGEDTSLDEFPWMALLHFSTRSGQDRGYGCGGSLINERYILTAAHCIKGPSLPQNTIVNTVRLGEYDVTKEKDCINGVCSPSPIDAAVEEIIVHPEYKPNNKAQHHDIALIRLRKKVPFSTYVSPICLPGEELKTKDYSGKQLVVAGWGKTANGAKGKSSSTKQKVSLPFVTLENCKPFYDGINIRLRNTQMCAGGEKDKDSCQGDSGGPLMSNEMVNGQSSWFVTGIVSFGPEDCGVKNIAGVYTKVSDYVDWILETIKE